MKNTIKVAYFAIALLLGFSTAACSSSSGGSKIVNSTEELKEYISNQPDNSHDNPIKVAMNANNLEFQRIAEAIMSSGKYVSLDLFGSPITAIPDFAFIDVDTLMETRKGCTGLIDITLPNRITSIGQYAFIMCADLKNITIPDKRKMTHFTQLQG